jgi:hypothetical protein
MLRQGAGSFWYWAYLSEPSTLVARLFLQVRGMKKPRPGAMGAALGRGVLSA